jgi:hypothetical protein
LVVDCIALEVDLIALEVDLIALEVDLIALEVDLIALEVDLIALEVDLIALGVDLIVLGVDLIALGIDSITLGIDLIALGIDPIALAINGTTVRYAPMRVPAVPLHHSVVRAVDIVSSRPPWSGLGSDGEIAGVERRMNADVRQDHAKRRAFIGTRATLAPSNVLCGNATTPYSPLRATTSTAISLLLTESSGRKNETMFPSAV